MPKMASSSMDDEMNKRKPVLPPAGVSGITPSGARVPVSGGGDPSFESDDPHAWLDQADPKELNPEQLHMRNERIAARRNRGSRRKPGEDVLVQVGQHIKTAGSTTPGVGRTIQRDIIEVPPPRTNKVARRMAVFQSADGSTYKFHLLDPRGKPFPGREHMMTLLAIRELVLGGNPLVVFDAFRLKMHDVDEKQLFPVLPEYLLRGEEMTTLEEAFRAAAETAPEQLDGFSLASGEGE